MILDEETTELDVTQATSLPSSAYTSTEIYERELDRIFYSKWLLVCHESQIGNTGDVRVQRIGQKSIIVVRGGSGELNAFHNVCRHRGSTIVGESCNTSVLQCPYHGWTYKPDGALVGAPHMEKTMGFRKEDYPLLPVRLEMWGGFVFVNFDSRAESLSSYLGDFKEKFNKYNFGDLKHVGRVGEYEVPANWKVYIENFNECYHCPLVHPETLGKYYTSHFPVPDDLIHGPYALYYFEDMEELSRTVAGTPPNFAKGAPSAIEGLTGEDQRRIYLLTLFPNTAMAISSDYVTTFQAWPVSVNRTKVYIDLYFPGSMAMKDPSGIMRTKDQIARQDLSVVAATQAGLESGVFQGGRFSELEATVYRFQRLVSKALDQSQRH
jgi:Rieske 2Fe-2S family protein